MTPTQEQQAIIDHAVPTGGALKVIAYAGTGKTSTLVELAQANATSDILYLAFNKSVESDGQMRFPTNTLVKTGHALAYNAVGKFFRSNIGNIYNWQIVKAYGISLYEASLTLATLENYLNSADDLLGEERVVEDHLGRFPEGLYKERILYLAARLWRDMGESINNMPMTHSGYLKLFALQHSNLGYPIVMLDEAQDTNPVMLGIMLDQMKNGSRVYFVGDPYQQVYSWRGAEDAMSKIEAPELYLTQSFRFGPDIAGFASKLLAKMFNNQRPLIGLDSIQSKLSVIDKSKTIICRTNAGLVKAAYGATLSDQTINVNGPDKFTQVLSDIDDLFALYSGNRASIKSSRIAYHANFGKLKIYAAEALDQELGSKIGILEDYLKEWPKVKEVIESHLVVLDPDITLTTCHKAKGLEWDRVQIGPDFAKLHVEDQVDSEGRAILKRAIKGRSDKPDGINQEEVNLIYVACTRAKEVLQLTNDLRTL